MNNEFYAVIQTVKDFSAGLAQITSTLNVYNRAGNDFISSEKCNDIRRRLSMP